VWRRLRDEVATVVVVVVLPVEFDVVAEKGVSLAVEVVVEVWDRVAVDVRVEVSVTVENVVLVLSVLSLDWGGAPLALAVPVMASTVA
jgi:hypothetical protein